MSSYRSVAVGFSLTLALTGCVAVPEAHELDGREQGEWIVTALSDAGYSGSDIEEQGQLYLEASDLVCSHASDWLSNNPGADSGVYWDMLDESVTGDLGNLFLHYVAYEVQCDGYAGDFQIWLEGRDS